MEDQAETGAKLKALAVGIYRIWIGERPGPLAASLAYYAIFSVVPITYLAVVLSGIFVDASDMVSRIETRLEDILGVEAVEHFSNAIEELAERIAQGTAVGSLISFIVLLFSASLIFFQLQYVLNMVWKAPPPKKDETRSYVRNRLIAFAMVLTVGLILILATVANFVLTTASTALNFEATIFFANFIVFVLLLMLFLAIIYKFLPNVEISWRDVLVGSAVTAFVLAIAIQIAGFLLSLNSYSSALQAAGAVAMFLISFYFLAEIFVLGAVFTRVYAELFGSQIKAREKPAINDASG